MYDLSAVPAYTPARKVAFREAATSAPISYGTREDGWRTLGNNGVGRELPSQLHQRMIALSFKAYRTNPLAHRLIEMQVNFVLGNGLSVNSTDANILQAIHRWWTDPYNNWPRRILPRLRDLYIYGEWLHRPLITPEGFVRVADVQPDAISGVLPEKYDHGVVDQVILRAVEHGGEVLKEYPVPVIRQRFKDATFELEPNFSGSLHYFGINRTSDSLRGVGDLFTLLDYIDVHDNMLFTQAEKIVTTGQFYYDITVNGMPQEELDRWVENHTNLPPRPASVFAHNEQVIMEPKMPKVNADDHSASVRTIKSHIIASAGYPGTWFDDPGSAGRAVGGEMAEPALRNIVNLQQTVGQFLRDEIDYYLEQLEQHGVLDLPEDRSGMYTISFSRPSARDLPKIGPAVRNLAQFITEVNKNLILTQEEQRQLVVSQVNQLGLSDAPLSLELPTELIDAKEQQTQLAADAQRAATAAKMAGPTTVSSKGGSQGGSSGRDDNPKPAGRNQRSTPQSTQEHRQPPTVILWS